MIRMCLPAILFVLLVFNSSASLADQGTTKLSVNKMTYTNQGGYMACPQVQWIDSNNRKQTWEASHSGSAEICTTKGEAKTVNLKNAVNNGVRPEDGQEVWLRINIDNGNKVSCRKDGKKFYYLSSSNDPENIAVVPRFKTEGTTTKNNRCKIANDGLN
jgi:hypothetical protein